MIENKNLSSYCADFLHISDFKDYCPNGLQIEGKTNIEKIICGVSANLALIERAIEEKADALFVHHGFFWKGESAPIIGIKHKRIKQLLLHQINLFAYHLPLDAHPLVGNNICLARLAKISNPSPIEGSLVWQGDVNQPLSALTSQLEIELKRKPLVFGEPTKFIRKIAWCSGAAQNYIDKAIEVGADAYLSGEISEQTPAIALENNIAYLSAGHHATERYGVQSLCAHLSKKFDLSYEFIDIDNIV